MPYADNDGVRIRYTERGRGEPLLLLMGLGAPGEVWELHAQAYERHFRCLLVDNRGAGHSDKPDGPYATAQMARDALAVLDAAGVERAHVAGISMGSGIAQELALAAPERVRSLVLVASWARCDAYMRAVFGSFRHLRAVASPADFVQMLQLWIWAPQPYNQRARELLEAQAVAAEGYMPLHAFQAQCDACAEHDTLERLGEISAPVLLTSGDADIFTPLRLSEEMEDLIPDAELLVLPGCGHVHHWEALETFNARTTEFMRGR
jgi:pimeloyl-ACP methyl ester carboxylesterase